MNPKRRRLLIVDVVESTQVQAPEPPKPVLTKQQLHAKAQWWLLDAARRYKYEMGLSDEFEAPLWKRVDRILKASTLEEAEKLCDEAIDLGTLAISVWHKKVKR